MKYEPYIRIILRYGVGALAASSVAFGDKLATDPDLVIAGSALMALIVEGWYQRAKRKGGNT